HEVVPVRDDVVDRAARLAERDAAVHAARALLRRGVVLERQHELAVVAHALARGLRDLGDALELHEAGDLAHYAAAFWLAGAAFADARAASPPSGRVCSPGTTLTNFARAASQSSSSASATPDPVKRRCFSQSSRRI